MTMRVKKAAKKSASGSKVFPIRLPWDMKERIEKLAAASRGTEANMAVQAIERGLPELEAFFGITKKEAA